MARRPNIFEVRALVLAPYMDKGTVSGILKGFGLRDAELADKNIQSLAGEPPARNLFADVLPVLLDCLSRCADPDMALNNFERFAAASHGKVNLYSTLAQAPGGIEAAVCLFGTSQYFADIIIGHPQYFDWLRGMTPQERVRSEADLLKELHADLRVFSNYRHKLAALRRFKHKEMLRIGYLDLVDDAPLETVTRAISDLAEVEIDGALAVAQGECERKLGARAEGEAARGFAVIGLGKLGGEELNYSSDIDIIFVYDRDEEMALGGRSVTKQEYFNKLAETLVAALTTKTDDGYVFRVDTRLRPEGGTGALARSLASSQTYYDTYGQTWERQALIKARAVAGDVALGRQFIESVAHFVYPRYLTFSQIAEVKKLKRRIEGMVEAKGETFLEVKSGYGGIRDIEFAVQFMQLLHGGELPNLQCHNTLQALLKLAEGGCITEGERQLMAENYVFLRRVEHRLQTMFSLQVHKLPTEEDELGKLAKRLGFADDSSGTALEKFRKEFRERTTAVRAALDRVFYSRAEARVAASPEIELVLNPERDEGQMEDALRKYGLKDVSRARANLEQMMADRAGTRVSSPRTREYFGNIASSLLQKLESAPDPDMALNNLERCVAAMGAKSVFYQMLAENPQALDVLVDLCAWSQYLSDILIRSPEMLDEVVDALAIGARKTVEAMRGELRELLAQSPDPVRALHEYQKGELLRIGIRDIQRKANIRNTMDDLSGLAEAILATVYERCREETGHGETADVGFAAVGLGKLGAREMNYGSDLDIIFVYERDGDRGDGVTLQVHFSELSQRIMRAVSAVTQWGMLYRIDPRLRPTGKSGILVSSFDELARYYGQEAQLWERQAITKARLVAGGERFGGEVMGVLRSCAYERDWQAGWVDEIVSMRKRLEATASGMDVKRGLGGVVDIEFLVEMLCLKYGRRHPRLQTPNTLDALHELHEVGLLSPMRHAQLLTAYEFMRMIENRMRIVQNLSLDRLPESAEDLAKLAKRMGYRDMASGSAAGTLLQEYRYHSQVTREIFLEVCKEQGEDEG